MNDFITITITITCHTCDLSISAEASIYDDGTYYEETLSPVDERLVDQFYADHDGHDLED